MFVDSKIDPLHRSSNEMDLLYQEFSTKLKKSTQELAKDSDEKDRYSALIDARMAALREQNKVLHQ